MSILKDIQIFIAENPGLTNKQIAASMPQYDVHAVQRGVCHLVKLNRATRQHNGKCYQYFAKAPGGDVSEGRSALKINRADNRVVDLTDSELDHRIALQFGGDNSESNLWTLCTECHAGKSAREAATGQPDEQALKHEVHDVDQESVFIGL
ncbi:HNH endonuclease [Enterobacter hormaechei]